MNNFEKRISSIEKRNRKVEADKAWETSWTRRLSISLMTYLVIVGFLVITKNDRPFINALVPVIGFVLSTLVLTGIKQRWVEKYRGTIK